VANERGFAMASAVRVRGDYEAAQLRALTKRSADAAQTRRLLALAAIYDGGSRTEAARLGLRYWAASQSSTSATPISEPRSGLCDDGEV
jgi:hypothetical protein